MKHRTGQYLKNASHSSLGNSIVFSIILKVCNSEPRQATALEVSRHLNQSEANKNEQLERCSFRIAMLF
jgi:hypothetical protein